MSCWSVHVSHSVVAFFQVISKSARKAPQTMVSSMGQNVEEDPDTVRYGGVGVYGSLEP